MPKLVWFVLWPSMMVAAVAEFAFFALFNPQELYLFGEPVHYSPMATYSIAFFGLWLICAVSSAVTLSLTKPPVEVNQSVG